MRAWLLSLSLLVLAVSALAAPTVHVPGYEVTEFGIVPETFYSADSPEVDGAGNLYVCAPLDGIYRYTPTGTRSLWSTATGDGLAMLPSGEAYLPTRSLLPVAYIYHLSSDGSYAPLAASTTLSWTSAALAEDGTLYADVWAGDGQGLYTIDRTNGTSALVVSQGPGPGPSSDYWDLVSLSTGDIYASGGGGVYRLSGDHFDHVATTPVELIGLARGPNGTILGAGFDGGIGSGPGQVWRIDPTSGVPTLVASGFGESVGVAFDATRDRTYVVEQSAPRKVWVIEPAVTATARTTWAALKQRFR